MLIKNPKPEYRRWIKKTAIVLFVAEAAAFTASYFLWSKVNTDRDTRRYLLDNYPSALDLYYRTGELLDSQNRTRQIDAAYWSQEKKN
ncbi:protein CEBPZOS [Aethina tumida]|uniref:protein CEBPZOS n=1 Tax=Aethina tumida TaxID=116153 RepID=UPI00096B358C|nr:protein CEBPZOS [Aethina tumida]